MKVLSFITNCNTKTKNLIISQKNKNERSEMKGLFQNEEKNEIDIDYIII